MKNIAIAAGTAVLLVSAVFGVVFVAGVPPAAAAALSAAFVTCTNIIHQILEKSDTKGLFAMPRSVVPMAQYQMPWSVVALYGTFLVIGAITILNAVAGLLAGAMVAGDAPRQLLGTAQGLFSIVTTVPALILIGRFAGRRAKTKPFLAILLVAVASRLGMAGIDYGVTRLTRKEPIVPIEHLVRDTFIVGPIVYFGLLIPGMLYGQRTARGTYLAFLVQQLPPDTGDVYLQLAYEDARRLVAKSVSAAVG